MIKKFLVIILLLITLSGCSKKNDNVIFNSLESLEGKKIGVVNGSYQIEIVEKNIKNAEIALFNTSSELVLSLKEGKIDSVVIDTSFAKVINYSNADLDYVEIEDTQQDIAFPFSTDGKLKNEFNTFLKDIHKSEFYEYCYDKWITNFSYENRLDEIEDYEATSGIIRVVCSTTSPPYVYVSNGEINGFAIELIRKFAQEYHYELIISDSNFDGILTGIASGKFDIGIDAIVITEERLNNLVFSDVVCTDSTSIIYLNGNSDNLEYSDYHELNGKNMGCMSGSIFDFTIQEKMPDSQIKYFNSRAELILGLKQNKIESYIADKPVGLLVCHDNDDIGYIDGVMSNIQYGICFSKKNVSLKDEFNKYLIEAKDDGYLEKLQNKWFKENAMEESIEDFDLSGEKGVIKVCTTPDAAPFAFYKDEKYQGYEIELIREFARRYGYDVQIEGVSFDALISSIASEKFDMAANGIYITEERKKSVDFSDPDYVSSAIAIVRKNVKTNESFITSLKTKFYRTFIEEDRYKLIIDGIITTLLITAASIIFGTLFGFLSFLLSRKTNVFKKIMDTFSYVIAGLPVVVILMILFYIIFSSSSISGVVISIIGFTIIVGCSVYGMLKTGVDAIDKGQFEAALALGYTDNKTLFKFILPQALRIIMPSYRGEIISLIKSSSIVGYVTVQDLTRVSDIIRSRTYDAFFPLIVTAIIYFVLAWLLTKLADYLQKKFLSNEKTKEEILKDIGQKAN